MPKKTPKQLWKELKNAPSANDILRNGLTLKQYNWAIEYMKTGNATQSALIAYPECTYDTAEGLGFENARNPKIINFIQSEMSKYLTEDFIIRELMQDVKNGNPQARSRALELLAKIKAMVSEKRINIEEQREEYKGITYNAYSEGDSEKDKDVPIA